MLAALENVMGPIGEIGSVIGMRALNEAFEGDGVVAALDVCSPPCPGADDCAEAGFDMVVPLSQTNFFPFFIQVNFFVAVELVRPTFVQRAPATGPAASAWAGRRKEVTSVRATAKEIFRILDFNSLPPPASRGSK
jgi:hypothetical protein